MIDPISTFEVIEETTPTYTVTLLDEDGTPIQGEDLITLTLTLYQEYTGVVVNTRDHQNVLQTNGVTVDVNGVLEWKMDVLDTTILNDSLPREPRIALFEFTYPGVTVTEYGKHEARILVRNLSKVPAP